MDSDVQEVADGERKYIVRLRYQEKTVFGEFYEKELTIAAFSEKGMC